MHGPDEEGLAKLKERMTRLNMSARAFDRILRVARTIADLDNSENVLARHIAEAIGYRSLDRAPTAQHSEIKMPNRYQPPKKTVKIHILLIYEANKTGIEKIY